MDFASKIQKEYNLSSQSVDELMSEMEEFFYVKNDVVVSEGEREDYVYFVEVGFVRSFIEREGKEVMFSFSFEGDMITSTSGNDSVSELTIVAVEDTTLFRISREQLERLYNKHIDLANWGRKIAEKALRAYDHFFINYYWADKSTQYAAMMKEYPQLIQSASLKDIASFLNVTPQSLSRIRANMK